MNRPLSIAQLILKAGAFLVIGLLVLYVGLCGAMSPQDYLTNSAQGHNLAGYWIIRGAVVAGGLAALAMCVLTLIHRREDRGRYWLDCLKTC